MDLGERRRRQIELEEIVAAGHGEDAGAGREAERIAVDQHVAGGERRVAAQIDFARRREPAQVIIGLAAFARHRECRFAEVILGRDGLHHGVVEPALERHDRGGISGQRALGERVDLEERKAGHVARSVISDGSRVSRSVCPSGSTWIRISVSGNRSCSASSTRSSRSWASLTVHCAGTHTWNCAK